MIAVDFQTFHQSRPGGNVTGVIYLDLDSGEFPERGWSDFPVIILSWWTETLLQLETERNEVQWRFMDGPYSANLTAIESDGSASAIDYEELRKSLLDAAERAAAHCEQHKMSSRDLETLRDNIEGLKANKTVQRTGASGFTQVEMRTSVAAGSRR